MHRALDRLTMAVVALGVCFSPSKYKLLLQDWTTLAPNLILDEKELTAVDRFGSLSRCLTVWGGYGCSQCSRGICQAEALVASTWYFTEAGRSCKLSRCVFCSVVWLWHVGLHAEGVRHLGTVDHRCLHDIPKTGPNVLVNNSKIKNLIWLRCSEDVQSNPILPSRLRWLGRILGVTSTHSTVECENV